MVLLGRLPLTKKAKYSYMGFLKVNIAGDRAENYCRICFGANHRTINCSWIFRDLKVRINVLGPVGEPYEIYHQQDEPADREEQVEQLVAVPAQFVRDPWPLWDHFPRGRSIVPHCGECNNLLHDGEKCPLQPVESAVVAPNSFCIGCKGRDHSIRFCEQWVTPKFMEPKLRPEWDGPKPAVEGCFNCLQTSHQTAKCPYPRMDDHCFRCGLQQVTCATCDRCYGYWKSLSKFHDGIGCCLIQEQYDIYLKTGLVPRKNLYVAKRPPIIQKSKSYWAKRQQTSAIATAAV